MLERRAGNLHSIKECTNPYSTSLVPFEKLSSGNGVEIIAVVINQNNRKHYFHGLQKIAYWS